MDGSTEGRTDRPTTRLLELLWTAKNYLSFMFHEGFVISQRTLMFLKNVLVPEWIYGGLIHLNLSYFSACNATIGFTLLW